MVSRYARTKVREGVVAVFHELHPDPVFCSQEQWRTLLEAEDAGEVHSLNDALRHSLRDRNILVEEPYDDDIEYERAIAALERKFTKPTVLYLMMAQDCNFECGYCPIPELARLYGGARLVLADAQAGIDLWIEHLKDRRDPSDEYFIIFYGGEPLLNKPVFERSLAYIDQNQKEGGLPKGLNLMLATNGALVDAEIVALCRRYGVMVAVGLDGPKAANDALKVDLKGNGTFDTIVLSIRLLVEGGIRTFASVTVTPFNIDEIDRYGSFFKELGIEKFGFNFLKGRLLLDLVQKEKVEEYYRSASRAVIRQFLEGADSGFEYQMEKKLHAFQQGDFFPVDCTCYGNQLVVQPDGQISHCPFYKANLGKPGELPPTFRIWDQPVVGEWRRRIPIYTLGEAKALWGGGCAWSMHEISGNALATDVGASIFAEEALDAFIWLRLATCGLTA